MKAKNVLNKSTYLLLKQELLDEISSSQLHPIDVYKIAKDISDVEMKRSKLSYAGISSSIVLPVITSSISISIGSKLLIGSTGIILSMLVTEYLKNRISINDLNEMLKYVQNEMSVRTLGKY